MNQDLVFTLYVTVNGSIGSTRACSRLCQLNLEDSCLCDKTAVSKHSTILSDC